MRGCPCLQETRSACCDNELLVVGGRVASVVRLDLIPVLTQFEGKKELTSEPETIWAQVMKAAATERRSD